MPLVQPVIGCIYLKNLQGLRDTLSREIKAPGLRTAQVNPTLLVTNQDLLLGNNQSSRPPSPPRPPQAVSALSMQTGKPSLKS